MTDQELDLLMKRVLVDSMKLELESDVFDSEVSFRPSPQYQRQMRVMLKDPLSWSRKKTRPMWKNIVQKVAVVLLVISLGVGTLMISSPTAWAAFTRWVTEWYESHVVYRYTGDGFPEDLPQYEIKELPEGFVESKRAEFLRKASITYKNESGDIIQLNYTFIAQGGATFFEAKDTDIFDIEINHMSGQFFESKIPGDFNTIIWIDTDQNIQFNLSGAYSCTDILNMAKSVSLVKTTK